MAASAHRCHTTMLALGWLARLQGALRHAAEPQPSVWPARHPAEFAALSARSRTTPR